MRAAPARPGQGCALEKYAARCGGGFNHRFGLDDAILIKNTTRTIEDTFGHGDVS
jgi:nicotinate-nucleotide pyrophosphorylase